MSLVREIHKKLIEGKPYLIKTKGKAIHYGLVEKSDIIEREGLHRSDYLKLKDCMFKTTRFTTYYKSNLIRLKYIVDYKQIDLTEEQLQTLSKKQLEDLLNE